MEISKEAKFWNRLQWTNRQMSRYNTLYKYKNNSEK